MSENRRDARVIPTRSSDVPPTIRREFQIGGRRLLFDEPSAPDDLVREAEAAGRAASGYWAQLWPSALSLAEHCASSLAIFPGADVLEIGCGLGLVSAVCALRGAEVVATDIDERCLELARRNARLNGVEIDARLLDWHAPGDGALRPAPDLLVGADVLYDPADHEAIARLIRSAGCNTILSDPDRAAASLAIDVFAEHGLGVWQTRGRRGRILLIHPAGH